MKCGGRKLLAVLLAAATAWNLGGLAMALRRQTQQAQLLEQAITAVQEQIDAQRRADGGESDEAIIRRLRQQGILHPVIWSFLTGDKWFGEAGAACEMPQK